MKNMDLDNSSCLKGRSVNRLLTAEEYGLRQQQLRTMQTRQQDVDKQACLVK